MADAATGRVASKLSTEPSAKETEQPNARQAVSRL